MTDATPQPWQRREDEPTLWYDRFLVYRDLGVFRSILEAWKDYRILHDDDINDASQCGNSAPPTWYSNAKKHDWLKRAAAHDDHVRDVWSDDTVLEKARRKRVMLLSLIAQKTGEELARRGYSESPGNQVTQAMKTSMRELREELGTGKTNVSIQLILDQLPPDVQTSLIELLDT
jgi:hypothetical protein